jgi:hypothetical protein
MAKAIVREADLPPYAQALPSRINAFGFSWKFVPEHRVGDVSRRVQIRTIGQHAPQRETSSYEQALRRGDQFPPVIFTADGYLVDGSTRTEAVSRVGWPTFPAFVLDVKAEGAPESVRKQLIALGAGFNATHGKRMNAANFAGIIDVIGEEDDSPKDLAKRLHIPESTANTLLNAAKAKRRADRLGVELNGTLTNSHLKLFGGKSQQFTDPVFAEFLRLAQDAHLTLAATTDLAKRLAVTGTERERIALLKAERRGYRTVIDGGAAHPSKAAKLRQTLGFLIGQNDADALAELDPNASQLHVQTLRDAARALDNAILAQQRVELHRLQESGKTLFSQE